MTQSGDPLENPVAERANGILKTEWLYHMEPLPEKQCPSALGRIITFYNDERPHMSIGYQTPSEAHRQSGEQKKCWKNPWDKPKETEKTPIFDPPNESQRRFTPTVTENPAGHRAPSAFAKREAALVCPAVMERDDNRFRDKQDEEA